MEAFIAFLFWKMQTALNVILPFGFEHFHSHWPMKSKARSLFTSILILGQVMWPAGQYYLKRAKYLRGIGWKWQPPYFSQQRFPKTYGTCQHTSNVEMWPFILKLQRQRLRSQLCKLTSVCVSFSMLMWQAGHTRFESQLVQQESAKIRTI